MSAPLALPPAADASFRAVARLLARALPAADLAADASRDQTLEMLARDVEPARVISAALMEDARMRSHIVDAPHAAGFAAFLDGTQASRALYYTADGAPVVHGTAAAVVRARRDRRLFTWRYSVDRRLYADRRRMSDSLWQALESTGLVVRDTGGASDESPTFDHPFTLRDAAIHRLQKDREAAEERLATNWCETEGRPIMIDGGISGSELVARSPFVVGVVKSHRTLYAEGDALVRVLTLQRGERSSVFRVTSPKRAAAASWYLRIRDRVNWDPMWGLVRVEVSAALTDDEISSRANEVSGWILGETTPVALPDSRWDKMVYGIRDCEEFLNAVT